MNADQIIQRVELLFEKKHYERVIESCNDLLEDRFELGRLWECYGVSLLSVGREMEGIAALEVATVSHPMKDITRILLAVGYGRIGKLQLATDLLLNLATSYQLDATHYLQIAAGFDALDNLPLAMQSCRKAWSVDPHLSRVYYDMGYYSLRSGRSPHVAEALIRRAIDLEPNHAGYRVGLMTLLRSQGRLDEAIAAVSSCTEQAIRDIKCKCCIQRVADFLLAHGETDAALRWQVTSNSSRFSER